MESFGVRLSDAQLNREPHEKTVLLSASGRGEFEVKPDCGMIYRTYRDRRTPDHFAYPRKAIYISLNNSVAQLLGNHGPSHADNYLTVSLLLTFGPD